MWYVLWTYTGNENTIRDELLRLLPQDSVRKIIIPQKMVQKKYRGEWREVTIRLYPEYLFVITENPEVVEKKLGELSRYSRFLQKDTKVAPISAEEEGYLRQMLHEGEVVEMSTGIIENEQIIIESGPLKGMEGLIGKIDRHKRMATIEFNFFYRKVNISVGLEVVKKRINR
jgi:transcription antitermination factor NusG